MSSCWYYAMIMYSSEEKATEALPKVREFLQTSGREVDFDPLDENSFDSCVSQINKSLCIQNEVSSLSDWEDLVKRITDETSASCGSWTSEDLINPLHYLNLINQEYVRRISEKNISFNQRIE